MEGEGGPQMRSPILYVVRHEVWCHPRFEGSFSPAVRVGLGYPILRLANQHTRGTFWDWLVMSHPLGTYEGQTEHPVKIAG